MYYTYLYYIMYSSINTNNTSRLYSCILYHGTAVLRVCLRRPHTHTHGRCANRQTGGLRKPRITKDLLLLSSRIASVFASRHKQTLWPSIRIPPLESLKPKHAELFFFVNVTHAPRSNKPPADERRVLQLQATHGEHGRHQICEFSCGL